MCLPLEEIWFHGAPPPFKLFIRVTFATSFGSNHNDSVIAELVLVVKYEVETVLALVPSLVIKTSCMPSNTGVIQIKSVVGLTWLILPGQGSLAI